MNRRLLLLLALLYLSSACKREPSNERAAVQDATVEEVAAWLQAGQATVFDANSEDFRKRNGTVPGAVLLASYREYDASVLGQDKGRQLVFYCTNRL